MYALILNENSFPDRYVMVGLQILPNFHHLNSRKITSLLVSAITDQVTTYEINKRTSTKLKMKSRKEKRYIDLLNNLKNEMSEPQRRINLINCEKMLQAG